MIYSINYLDMHRIWDLVVVRRGPKKTNLEFAVVPGILDDVSDFQRRTKKFVRRISAVNLPDMNGFPYPNSSIVRKSLPDDASIEFNTESDNLSLFLDGNRIDLLHVN